MDNANFHDRRDFLRLAGLGGVVMASALARLRELRLGPSAAKDFSFVQLSDVHWGYANPKVNPEPRQALLRAIAAVNALEQQPDFVVFTGDLTQTTDDPRLRRARLREVKEIAAGLKAPQVRFFAGEHDASLDRGEAYLEVFGGALNYTFDHGGVHFIVLDNTSQPAPVLGEAQLDWLRKDLAGRAKDAPIVVLTHRPLFPLYPQWDWATRDGRGGDRAALRACERHRLLRPRPSRAPPHDRAHRPPRGAGGDVSAVAAWAARRRRPSCRGMRPGRSKASAGAASICVGEGRSSRAEHRHGLTVHRRQFALAALRLARRRGRHRHRAAAPGGERRIHVGAARFAFSVAEISARQGRDPRHRPDRDRLRPRLCDARLKARIDVPPGKESS